MPRFMKPKVVWVRSAVGRRDNLEIGRDRRDRRLLMDAGFALLNQRRRGLLGSGGASVAAVVRQVGKPPYGHG